MGSKSEVAGIAGNPYWAWILMPKRHVICLACLDKNPGRCCMVIKISTQQGFLAIAATTLPGITFEPTCATFYSSNNLGNDMELTQARPTPGCSHHYKVLRHKNTDLPVNNVKMTPFPSTSCKKCPLPALGQFWRPSASFPGYLGEKVAFCTILTPQQCKHWKYDPDWPSHIGVMRHEALHSSPVSKPGPNAHSLRSLAFD